MALYVASNEGKLVRNGLAPWRERRVIQFIDANLTKPITLRDLAEQAGLSRMYFAAQFRLSTGLTPHAFLLNRRIDHAKRLMSTTDIPLIQVALEVGFQSHAHFSTVFRKFTGTTPGKWRCETRGVKRHAGREDEGAVY
jgi:AraC family transcriptional regulator